MTTFDPWLRQLASAGMRLPKPWQIDRGLAFSQTIRLGGNWTGGAMKASLRLEPDATGPTLVDLTASDPAYDADTGRTAFTLSLTKAQTAALLADNDGDALVEIAVDVLFTPSGGAQGRLLGGVAIVTGKVTDAS